MSEPAVDLAVILAGGLSRRMGADKAGISLAGRPLVAHVAERIAPQARRLMVNAPAGTDLPYPLLPDTLPDRPGPLAGILAAMRHAESLGAAKVLTVPVDTPFLPRDLAERLATASTGDTIAVASSGGRIHPVAALWPAALASDLETWLAEPDHRRLTDFLARHPVVGVDFALDPVDPFFNVNTPDDLARAETLLTELHP
ncbi:molybdenum cofactor guanylyltransferase [Pseudomonas sp. R2.Fl]|nr:molybdenum cofactor guanylyltransferase [Pseudomonas sp. R2.Fl]